MKRMELIVQMTRSPWFLRRCSSRDGRLTYSDKVLSMDGGGEDSVAYILLYR